MPKDYIAGTSLCQTQFDAQQLLAHFAATARNETDLDALTTELPRVVQETMQPEQASVWLKSSPVRTLLEAEPTLGHHVSRSPQG